MEQPQTSPALNRPLDHYVKMPPSREELQEANEDSDLCPALSFKVGTLFNFAGITWDCQPKKVLSVSFIFQRIFHWQLMNPTFAGSASPPRQAACTRPGFRWECRQTSSLRKVRGAAAVGWLYPNTNISLGRCELDG
jgi:hypothetical protein